MTDIDYPNKDGFEYDIATTPSGNVKFINILIANIRKNYPEFIDVNKFTDTKLNIALRTSWGLISPIVNTNEFDNDIRAIMLYLATCHLLATIDNATQDESGAKSGFIGGILEEVEQGQVRVRYYIDNKDKTYSYFNSTVYGKELYYLLSKYKPIGILPSQNRLFYNV